MSISTRIPKETRICYYVPRTRYCAAIRNLALAPVSTPPIRCYESDYFDHSEFEGLDYIQLPQHIVPILNLLNYYLENSMFHAAHQLCTYTSFLTGYC